jgi:MFS family permease
MTLQQTDVPQTHRTAWALMVLSATQLMVILDGTIVNVALPTIRTQLGFSDTGLSWVVNAFFVVFAVLLLPAGRLGDLVGGRRVFLAGLVLFTVASPPAGWPRVRPGCSPRAPSRAPAVRSPRPSSWG